MKKLKRNRQHQEDMVRWTSEKGEPHFGLQADMRTGKNLVVIRTLLKHGNKGPVLVVCPNSAFDGWLDDLRGESKMRKITLLNGSADERLSKLLDNFSSTSHKWFIINKEGWKSVPDIKDMPWWCVVIDESRFLSTSKKASKFFLTNFRDVPIRIILSGTMDYKHKLEYYNQIAFLNKTWLPYTNYWHFRESAFTQCGFNWRIKPAHDRKLIQCLKKHFYTMRRSELDFGRTKRYQRVYLKFPKTVKSVYQQVKDEFMFEHKDLLSKTMWATTQAIWLMRFCGGHIEDTFLWSGKLNKLIDIINEKYKNDQVVIICRFKQEIYKLLEVLDDLFSSVDYINGDVKMVDRRKKKIAFNSKKIKILICESVVVAKGTDLKSAKAIIFYSQPNGKELRDQVEDRIITLDNNDKVDIIDILVKGTIEEDYRNTIAQVRLEQKFFESRIKGVKLI